MLKIDGIRSQLMHTYRAFKRKEIEKRGLLAALAQQIGTMPQVREIVCGFTDLKKYPQGQRPMVTLHQGEPSVYILGWRHGEFTEIHDHGTCEVAVYGLQGTVCEDIYTPLSVYGKGRQLSLAISRFVKPGDLLTCPEQYVHRMGNFLPEPAATLHVYGPALNEMRLFDVVEGVMLQQKGCWESHHDDACH